jgi:hypothetical protein
MLQIKSLRADVMIDPGDLRRVLATLSDSDWKPALMEAQKRVFELASVVDRVPLPITRPIPLYGRHLPPDAFAGDVFFRGDDVFFLLTIQGESEVLARRAYILREAVGKPDAGTEVGIITNDASEIDQKLQSFADAFQQCTITSLDGRKTRHMQFSWQPLVVGTPRLDSIMGPSAEEPTVSFGRPTITSELLLGAQALGNEGIRTMLTDLSQAGFARAQDILSRKGKKQQEAESALSDLKQLDLLTVEYLLECKRTGTPLTRLAKKEQLENPTIGELRCATCNKLYSEENVSEGYSVSQLGRRLCAGSHWMTVLVTDELIKAGVPQTSILWNLSEGGEEVDILVEFMGELWILELKDRGFGSGDAHPLNYRQVRYKATKAIVVTTDKVSKDARRVFEDLAKERSGRSGVPVYIEGLAAVHDAIAAEVARASVRFAYQKLAFLTLLSGYDLRPIIAAKFGQPVPDESGRDLEILYY